MNSSGMVSAEIKIRLIAPGKPAVPLSAGLFYTARSPYAVRVAFFVGRGERVEWTFARELLSQGLEGAAGLGDVRVWSSPGQRTGFRRVLHLEISSPSGTARFEIPARGVRSFLRSTYALVPAAAEGEHIDFETGLRDLLRESH